MVRNERERADRRRIEDLRRFYKLLDDLATRSGGPRRLSECSGSVDWPSRGVYFFFESSEARRESGAGGRVVRVGTHALKEGSQTTLWKRLSQHRGTRASGGGNHRGSIFRLLIGAALIRRDGYACASWGQGNSAPEALRRVELEIERRASAVIGAMPFLWLKVDDTPGPSSLRGTVERNSIALLSCAGKSVVDAPSPAWLGRHCPRDRVQASGLWNQNHVDEGYDPAFLDVLQHLIDGA